MRILSTADPYLLFWLALTIVFVVCELISIGLTSIWFAVGGIVALIAAALGANIVVQIILFLLVSILLLWATRPWAEKFVNSRVKPTNADRLIGESTRLTERVSNLDHTGKTVIFGKEWTVRTENDKEIIENGELVEILRISGVKLIVKKKEED